MTRAYQRWARDEGGVRTGAGGPIERRIDDVGHWWRPHGRGPAAAGASLGRPSSFRLREAPELGSVAGDADERSPLGPLAPEAVTPRPFPFASLPAVSRDEIAATRRARHAARSLVRPELVASALAELCEAPVTIAVRRVRPSSAAPVPADAVGVALAPAEDPGMNRAVLVELDGALASTLVALALRQRAPRVMDGSRAPAPTIAGAAAAIVHAALRRAHAGAPLRVVAAGPAQALARDLDGAHRRVASAVLAVAIGPDVFAARVHVPLEELPPSEERPMSLAALTALGDAPIALPLVAGTCLVDRIALAALAAGDTLIVPGAALREAGGQLLGPVALVAPRAERGLGADLAEGGRLVLRTGRSEDHPWDVSRGTNEERTMSDELIPTLEVLEDAPVVVRVELGVVEMKAREWAALSEGDVVSLGRRLGDPAVLRVGGVEVARGELVQVDGEYGVRILGRHGGQ